MNRNWAGRKLKVLVWAAAAIAVFGFLVMNLWNWLMPVIFGWKAIHFWQAVGVIILSRILFGGFHGRPCGHMLWRHRMRERWEQMTPEEREKFREGLQHRCGCGSSEPQPPQSTA